MYKDQRANALQKATAAEVAAFQLGTYLEDIGLKGEILADSDQARMALRAVTTALAKFKGEDR